MKPGLLAYSVLSVCRAAATLDTGEPCTKQEGAAWARLRLAQWTPLIDAALACRLSRGVGCFDDAPTRAAAAEFIQLLASHTIRAAPHGRKPRPVELHRFRAN